MNNIRHIHEVIFLVQKKGKYENTASLHNDIIDTMGEDVQFSSCSNNTFSLDKVVEFLVDRNKIVVNTDGSIKLHPEMTMCNSHEDGHHHH